MPAARLVECVGPCATGSSRWVKYAPRTRRGEQIFKDGELQYVASYSPPLEHLALRGNARTPPLLTPLLTYAKIVRAMANCTLEVAEIERFLDRGQKPPQAVGALLSHWHAHRGVYKKLLSARQSPLVDSCAVVGKSWSLDRKNHSARIDAHSLVFRTNGWVPAPGTVAGSRTDVLLLNKQMSREWASGKRKQADGGTTPRPVYNLITAHDHGFIINHARADKAAVAGRRPALRGGLLILDPTWPVAAKSLLRMLGAPPARWPTHGMMAVLLALAMCRSVSVFGMSGLAPPTTPPRKPPKVGRGRALAAAGGAAPDPRIKKPPRPGFTKGFYSDSVGPGKNFWTAGHALTAEHELYKILSATATKRPPRGKEALALLRRMVRAKSFVYQQADGSLATSKLPAIRRGNSLEGGDELSDEDDPDGGGTLTGPNWCGKPKPGGRILMRMRRGMSKSNPDEAIAAFVAADINGTTDATDTFFRSDILPGCPDEAAASTNSARRCP